MPNWCENHLTVKGEYIELAKMLSKFRPFTPDWETTPQNCHRVKFIDQLIPMPEALEGTTSPSVKPNWYDWQLENWGIKWGDCETVCIVSYQGDEGMAEIFFQSPWAPPIKALDKIAEMYPTLEFHIEYDEPGMDFSGEQIWKAGIIWHVDERDYSPIARSWEESENA